MTGGRDPSFHLGPQPGCPGFHHCQAGVRCGTACGDGVPAAHSHPACPLEFAYCFRPGPPAGQRLLPTVRTTNKISKQFVAPAGVRQPALLLQGPRPRRPGPPCTCSKGSSAPTRGQGRRLERGRRGAAGEPRAQVSRVFHSFVHPSSHSFILAFHSFLSAFIPHLWRHAMGVSRAPAKRTVPQRTHPLGPRPAVELSARMGMPCDPRRPL